MTPTNEEATRKPKRRLGQQLRDLLIVNPTAPARTPKRSDLFWTFFWGCASWPFGMLINFWVADNRTPSSREWRGMLWGASIFGLIWVLGRCLDRWQSARLNRQRSPNRTPDS